MRYQLNCSLYEAAARLDVFLSSDAARLSSTRRLVGKRRGLDNGVQTYKLEVRDESFFTTRWPKVFLKGQMIESEGQTTVIANFTYPLQLGIFYLIIAAILMIHPEFFSALVFLSIVPGVMLLMHNSENREDLAQAMEDCFGEKDELQS